MTPVYSPSRAYGFTICNDCDHWCGDDTRWVVPRVKEFVKKCKCECHVEGTYA